MSTVYNKITFNNIKFEIESDIDCNKLSLKCLLPNNETVMLSLNREYRDVTFIRDIQVTRDTTSIYLDNVEIDYKSNPRNLCYEATEERLVSTLEFNYLGNVINKYTILNPDDNDDTLYIFKKLSRECIKESYLSTEYKKSINIFITKYLFEQDFLRNIINSTGMIKTSLVNYHDDKLYKAITKLWDYMNCYCIKKINGVIYYFISYINYKDKHVLKVINISPVNWNIISKSFSTFDLNIEALQQEVLTYINNLNLK